MSLNKTLDRLFDEIRREAKRNPDFANRLDAVLQLHDSRRDVPEGVVEEIASAAAFEFGACDFFHLSSLLSAAAGRRHANSGATPSLSPLLSFSCCI